MTTLSGPRLMFSYTPANTLGPPLRARWPRQNVGQLYSLSGLGRSVFLSLRFNLSLPCCLFIIPGTLPFLSFISGFPLFLLTIFPFQQLTSTPTPTHKFCRFWDKRLFRTSDCLSFLSLRISRLWESLPGRLWWDIPRQRHSGVVERWRGGKMGWWYGGVWRRIRG